MEKLFNWDHEINKTDLESIFLNFVEHSTKFTGRKTRICVEKSRYLKIGQWLPEETERYVSSVGDFYTERKIGGYWKTAVVLDLYSHGREILGRMRDIGNINAYRMSEYVDEAMKEYRL